jgi:hypothetical protein
MKAQDENKNGTIVSQNGTRNPVIRLVRTLDSYADIDYTFDESLVPNGIFREVYDYIKDRTDVPEQFIFTSVLAMFCGIVGNRISLKCSVWKIKPHDYFTLIGDRDDINTALKSVSDILYDLEDKITGNPYQRIFLYPEPYPQSSILRRLLDWMREESENELYARTFAKEKGKPEPPPKVAQQSGVAIIYEVGVLFDAMKRDSNTELAYALIRLWDGSSTDTMMSFRTYGMRRMWPVEFKNPALTLLSASTLRKFVEHLPKRYLDLILSRSQIINAGRRLEPLKSLGRLISEWQNNGDEIKKRYNEILEKLKQFYQFVCTLSQSKSPVLVSDEAEALDEQSAQAWHEERTDLDETTAGYMTEITARYMTRLDVHKVRYALLFSILECFDQHGQSADAITITGTAVQKAIEVCELYKTHTLHFLVKAKEIRPKLFRW